MESQKELNKLLKSKVAGNEIEENEPAQENNVEIFHPI